MDICGNCKWWKQSEPNGPDPTMGKCVRWPYHLCFQAPWRDANNPQCGEFEERENAGVSNPKDDQGSPGHGEEVRDS